MKKIGVLALQGAFKEHVSAIRKLGEECIEIRKREDLDGIDGLILPGGESTVQGMLLHKSGLFERVRSLIEDGIPTLATCAGLILLASSLSNDENTYLSTIPMTVRRNAFGRQLGSYYEKGTVLAYSDFPMMFIRAPYIEDTGEGVETIAVSKNQIVGVKYRSQMALAFHPELTDDLRLHEFFLSEL
ncbi:MAG: pyridoxal 5'-phosphate synthase glutaminase subunit PdxT [Candidatus Ornithospirochaeta sp.]